jgi:hypothetical protein
VFTVITVHQGTVHLQPSLKAIATNMYTLLWHYEQFLHADTLPLQQYHTACSQRLVT